MAQYLHSIALTSGFAQIALFKMQEGKGKDLVEFFLSPKGLDVTRAYKGCIQFDVFTEVNDPDAVRIYEKWESKEDWDAYIQFRGQSGEMDFHGPPRCASEWGKLWTARPHSDRHAPIAARHACLSHLRRQ
jgi:quinol monooxygenase YgiN